MHISIPLLLCGVQLAAAAKPKVCAQDKLPEGSHRSVAREYEGLFDFVNILLA